MKTDEPKTVEVPACGPQSAHVWKALCEKSTKSTMKSLEQKFHEYGCMRLDSRQAKVIEAMIYGVIIGAYHNVAEEAVKGEDVTGALLAGDV